jgi:hypothetical protein
MAALSDEASEHLTVEFTYEGYSVFCKLSYLTSLLKDSPLENKIKLPVERVHQMFLLMLLKIQKNVEDKLQGIDPELMAEDTLDAEPSKEDTEQSTVLGNDVGESEDDDSVQPDSDQRSKQTKPLTLSQVRNSYLPKGPHPPPSVQTSIRTLCLAVWVTT